MSLTLRENLGRELTVSEMDGNFEYLDNNPNILKTERTWLARNHSLAATLPAGLDKSDKSTLGGISGNHGRLVEFPSLRGYTALTLVHLQNNAFPEDVVNQILVDMDANGNMNGAIRLHGGLSASPSGDGVTAKNSLMNKNWTIITN